MSGLSLAGGTVMGTLRIREPLGSTECSIARVPAIGEFSMMCNVNSRTPTPEILITATRKRPG